MQPASGPGFAPPPPPLVPPPPSPGADSAWAGLTEPEGASTASAWPESTDPGIDAVAEEAPVKRKSFRRKPKPAAPAEAAVASGALAATGPTGATEAAADPLVWKPPVDPATGEVQWDGSPGPAAGIAVEEVPVKRKSFHRKPKPAAPTEAAAAETAVGAAAPGVIEAEGVTAPEAPSGSAPWGDQPWGEPGGDLSGTPSDGSGAGSPLDPFVVATAPLEEKPAAKSNRTTLLLLGALVVVVVVAGAIYLVKKHNSNNAATTTTVAPAPSGAAADLTLAGTINLRLTDLPAGWTRGTAVASVRPPAPSATARASAQQALATCLGQPVAAVSGLLGPTPAAGQTASATSPTYVSSTVPGLQMFSTTSVLANAADAKALTAPLAAPTFLTCYGQYESALVSAAVPGSTAQVTAVTLTAPAPVTSYGYLITYTIPGQGTEVVGQAFIIGGRTATVLEPSTTGSSIPSADFNPPYTAVVGRVAQAAG